MSDDSSSRGLVRSVVWLLALSLMVQSYTAWAEYRRESVRQERLETLQKALKDIETDRQRIFKRLFGRT